MPEVYFAFPDRTYHYDCAKCDALCCRGHGIGTTAKETPALLSHYPNLAWAATKHGKSGSDFTNPTGACFFLDDKNLCQIEKDHGRKAKPGVCVMFPFNDFSRIGDVIVVRPHFLCPLRLVPGKGIGNHSELKKMLEETGGISRALDQPGPQVSPEFARTIVRREEEFREKCTAAIGKGAFESLLIIDKKWKERAIHIWGIASQSGPRDYLDDILLALAPPLRMRMALLSEKQRMRVLSLAGEYVRNVARVTSRPITLQGAHHMIVNVWQVLRFLAKGNVRMNLSSTGVTQGVEFQNPLLTLEFFQILEQLQNGQRLFDVLEGANLPRITSMERAIFFHQLATRVREMRKRNA